MNYTRDFDNHLKNLAFLKELNDSIQQLIAPKTKADFIRKYAPEIYANDFITYKQAVECACDLYEEIEKHIKEHC